MTSSVINRLCLQRALEAYNLMQGVGAMLMSMEPSQEMLQTARVALAAVDAIILELCQSVPEHGIKCARCGLVRHKHTDCADVCLNCQGLPGVPACEVCGGRGYVANAAVE